MERFCVLFLMIVVNFGCLQRENPEISSKSYNQDYSILATLWIQNSAEYRALVYQAFNIARLRLDMDLQNKNLGSKKRAIIVDVDETILDNSPYQAKNIIKNEIYSSDNWKVWIDQEAALPTPGAVDFLQYVVNNGVEIFYVTNRKIRSFEETYRNLVKVGFPVKKENMFLRVKQLNKKDRRNQISKNYRIVLFLGDTMNDFSDHFYKKSTKERLQSTDSMREEFGSRMIIFPNPIYGDWEGAIYDYNYKKSSKQKKKDREKHLYPMKL